jgi:hypothetical protein
MTSVGGNLNMPLFDFVSERLRAAGCEVFNPADHARSVLGSLEEIKKLDKKDMAEARKALLKDEIIWILDKADTVLMLPGWERSTGATAERAVALAVNIPVRDVPNIVMYGSKNVNLVDIMPEKGEIVPIKD